MIVLKFGGTSVGNAKMIKVVGEIIKSAIEREPKVVVSAMEGVTDYLKYLASLAFYSENYNEVKLSLEKLKEKHSTTMKELSIEEELLDNDFNELEYVLKGIFYLKELNPKIFDKVMSFGEVFSSKIIAQHLRNIGIKANAYMAYDVGFITDSNFGNAEVLEETETNIRNAFKNIHDEVPIVTGYIAKNKKNEITTLGRGGSDYTATILASALNAEEVQIWTDVDGIMTADPKIVKNPKSLEVVSYQEASELAFLGAKVLHPKTILPVMKKKIPVVILNTFNRNFKGTRIVYETDQQRGPKSIACKSEIKLINVYNPNMFLTYGYLSKLFKIFEDHRISVDLVSTSEVNVSLTVDKSYNIEETIEELKKIGYLDLKEKMSSISLVGEGIAGIPGITAKVFSALGNRFNIEMISAGASKVSLSFVVNQENLIEAVNLLHDEFFGE